MFIQIFILFALKYFVALSTKLDIQLNQRNLNQDNDNKITTIFHLKHSVIQKCNVVKKLLRCRLSISLPIYKDNNISVECRQVSCFFRIISYSIHYDMKNMQ